MELPSKPADKAVRDGGATYIRPPSPHRFIIRMKPAARRYPLCLMCSSPYNLCRSHTLPFCPTSNPYSPFHSADTPVSLTIRASSLRTRRERHRRCDETAISGRRALFLLLPSCPPTSAPAHLMTVVLPIPRSVCKNRPANSVMKLDCHLLPAGTSPSLWVSRTAAGETEQHCHLLWMQIQLSS